MNKILEMKFGSHLYGCDTPSSDSDFKAIYIPSAREIVLNTYKKTINTVRPKKEFERNNKDDVDVEIVSVDQFCKLLSQNQTMAIDMLFCPDNMFTYRQPFDHTFEIIRKNKDKFLSKNVMSFFHYAKQQASKYGLKGFRVDSFQSTYEFLSRYYMHQRLSDEEVRPHLDKFIYNEDKSLKNEYVKIIKKAHKNGVEEEYLFVADKMYPLKATIKIVRDGVKSKFDEYGKRAIQARDNIGCDFKALSHAVRVNSEGLELLTTGKVTFPRPDRQLLLDIKTGKMEYKFIAPLIEEGLEKLKEAEKHSVLREKPDQQWIDDFIFDLYKQVVMNG